MLAQLLGEYALAALSHRDDLFGWPGRMPATVKYALTYLFVQAEFGLCCPVSMTDSLARTLKKFGAWLLEGDKWFCSNPDAALALVLARVEGAPSGMARGPGWSASAVADSLKWRIG